MSDPHAGQPAHEGDPDVAGVITVGIVTVILLLAVMVFALVLFQNAQVLEDERKLLNVRSPELVDEQTRQLAQISQYRYVSEAEGIVAIPIDRAIDLFIGRIQEDPRHASPYSATIAQPPDAPASTQATGAP